MPKNRISPHDRFIRKMMSHPQVVEEFMQANLPPKIKDAIDFQSIELQKESFVGDKLDLQIADLLYAAKFHGKPGYIYVLLEHASKPDRLLPFRMLKYMVAILDHHLTKTGNKELPVIYPLVFYTGNRPFTHSMDLFDLFGEHKALVKDILKNPYHLIDLTQASDEDLKKYLWFGTVALTAKHIHDKDFFPFFADLLKTLKIIEERGETSYIEIVISYVAAAAEVSDQQRLMETLETSLDMDEGKVMTILEYLKPKFEARARQEAAQEALQKALRALSLLKLQKKVEEISKDTGLAIQDIEALKKTIN